MSKIYPFNSFKYGFTSYTIPFHVFMKILKNALISEPLSNITDTTTGAPTFNFSIFVSKWIPDGLFLIYSFLLSSYLIKLSYLPFEFHATGHKVLNLTNAYDMISFNVTQMCYFVNFNCDERRR